MVYFTTGHSERNTTDSSEDGDGYGLARAGLLGDNYIVRTLNLREVEEIPEDAAVLIMAGPENSILMDEREMVERYLKAGGRGLFLIDDAINTQMNTTFAKFGIQLPQGTIVDTASSTVADPRSPIIRRSAYNQEHPVTRQLDDTFLTDSTGIVSVIERAPEGLPPNPDELNIQQTPLAFSSLFSCITAERDASDCSDEDDIPGPFALAMAVQLVSFVGEEAPALEPGQNPTLASMIIFGDSDFAGNKFYYALNNSDLFLNSVDWLAQKYDLISIRAKPQAFRLLVIDQREFDFHSLLQLVPAPHRPHASGRYLVVAQKVVRTMSIRTSIILVVALAMVAGYVFFIQLRQVEEEKEQPPWFYNLDISDLTRIHIKGGEENASFHLGEDNVWRIGDPDGIPVGLERWGGITLLLTGPRSRRLLDEQPAELVPYGLDAPPTVVEVDLKDGRSINVLPGAYHARRPERLRPGGRLPAGVHGLLRVAREPDQANLMTLRIRSGSTTRMPRRSTALSSSPKRDSCPLSGKETNGASTTTKQPPLTLRNSPPYLSIWKIRNRSS